ncbi:hypothetical protein GL279_15625 [Paracoccus limosus]|uniref:Uncharacterized protein n=1 Tax=Paracoccus limosus TaxID=913252 RepID=A0A844H9D9_9RHOB|nr:hypothetical protein [Paracoccus limosus]MTH36031.1 hypothetical protein [Paracoccus limosus]
MPSKAQRAGRRTVTPPDLLGRLPETVAALIQDALPDLRECRGIAGRLNVEQIRQLGIKTPAVLVSRLRARQDKTYAGPHHTFRLQMAAFILCKDELGLPRDLAAANISQVLLGLIPDQQWGLIDDAMPAEAVAEESLVSIEANKQGPALTAITWDQVLAVAPFPAIRHLRDAERASRRSGPAANPGPDRGAWHRRHPAGSDGR